MGINRRADGRVGGKVYFNGSWYRIGSYATEEEARAAIAVERARLEDGTSALITGDTKHIRDFAASICVPRGTINRWISEGMPSVMLGNTVAVPCTAAQAWISENRPNSVSFARDALIYVVQRDRDDAIKIGWTSNPERRLHELRRDERCAVNLLAAFAGDKPVELKLHKRFKAFRIDGEWFSSAPAIHDWLATIRSAAA